MDLGNPPRRTVVSTVTSASLPSVASTVTTTTQRENIVVQEEVKPHRSSSEQIELLEAKMARKIGLVDDFTQLKECHAIYEDQIDISLGPIDLLDESVASL